MLLHQHQSLGNIFHSNRSLAALSLGKYALATEDGEKCVALKPDWGKGYSRLGTAHFYAGRFTEAASAYGKGLAVEPTNDGLIKGLQAANAEINKLDQVILWLMFLLMSYMVITWLLFKEKKKQKVVLALSCLVWLQTTIELFGYIIYPIDDERY